jgi:hypothetical protein
MPSRLRSNFSRKIHKYKHRKQITRRLKKKKSISMKHRSRSTKGRHRIQKGGNTSTKKYEGFDIYGNVIDEVAVSSPMQWDD